MAAPTFPRLGTTRSVDPILNLGSVAPVEDDPVRYNLLLGNRALADSQVLRMINGMEIEEFLPYRQAILLKLNWNEVSFSSAILSTFIQSLRESSAITPQFATFLFGKLGNSSDGNLSSITTEQLEDVLHYLYAVMRFTSEADAYSVDDFMRMDKKDLLKFISTKEELRARSYLAVKLRDLSDRYTNARHIIQDLLHSIHEHDNAGFKDRYIAFLNAISVDLGENIRGFIFEELKQTVSEIEPEEVFRSLYRILKTHEFYGKQLTSVVNLTQRIRGLPVEEKTDALFERCRNAYLNSLRFLADYKNMSCGSMTLYSLQYGLIRKEWSKINACFERHRHRLCDCHAALDAERKALWPLNQTPFTKISAPSDAPAAEAMHDRGEHVAVFGCGWGSGHKTAARSTAEIVAREGYHPVTIDIPAEMLSGKKPEDVEVGAPAADFKQKVFNSLLTKKHFALINALRSLSGLNKTVPLDREQVRKSLQRLLLINPSHAITTIGSQSEPVFKACEILGIPCIHLATDVDRSVYVRNAPLAYDYYKVGLPYQEEDMFPRVSTTERPDQIVVSGPPTNPVFNQVYTREQIRGFRTQLQERGLAIPEDKRLIVVSNGSNGAYSSVPQLIVDYCKGKTADQIPFVVVVLCGHGEDYKSYIASISATLPRGVMQPAGFLDQADVNKLYRIASYGGGVIGKSGGLTVFELSKCGTRLLVDNLPSKTIPKSEAPSLWATDVKSGNPIRFARGLVLGLFFGVLSLAAGFGSGLTSGFLWLLNLLSQFPGMQDNYLAWEMKNQEFAIAKGFAQTVSSKEEFHARFEEFLLRSPEEPVALETENFSQRLPAIMADLSDRVAEDPSMHIKRQFVDRPSEAAQILFSQTTREA